MKNRLLNSFFRAAAAFALLLAAGACKDDVALPMQRVALNTHAILAPSFATTLSFDVEANCDWTISVAGDDTSWAELSQTEATGMATVAVSIAENNTSGSRALTIRVAAKRNAAVVEELSFVQASATAEGYLSIPDLRKLAADGDYSVTQDVKMRGIVVSSVQDNNYYDNCIALQSALKANCGITLRTDEVLYRKPGEELEIDLKGAVVGVNPETGVMEVKPAADDKVSRTETTQVKIEALKITYEELRSGAYESMYAGIYSQVYVPEGGSLNGITLKDDLSMQDPDNNRFRLVASQASSFGIDPAPTGSGVLKGIVVPQDGAYGRGQGTHRAALRRPGWNQAALCLLVLRRLAGQQGLQVRDGDRWHVRQIGGRLQGRGQGCHQMRRADGKGGPDVEQQPFPADALGR